MTKNGWKATVLREELYEEVQEIVNKPKMRPPDSVAGFIEAAVREKLERDGKKN